MEELAQYGIAGAALLAVVHITTLIIKERQASATKRHEIDPYQVILDNAAAQRESAEATRELITWLKSREDADIRDRERMMQTQQELAKAVQGIVAMCKELLERVKELRQ